MHTIPEPASLHAEGKAGVVRAHVWIDSAALFRRDEARHYGWLWLSLGDGRAQAFRVDRRMLGRDEWLVTLLETGLDDNTDSAHDLGMIEPLPNATIVPLLRWSHSWGHPLNRAVRAYAATLDESVLHALGQLEGPGLFLGTVSNYNRLATLPQPVRERRLQALVRFPPLIMPLLLQPLSQPELFEPEEEPAPSTGHDPAMAAVLDAIDHGRDLVGALARHWQIDRALVRSHLMRRNWPSDPIHRWPGGEPGIEWTGARRFGFALRLLAAMPAHARPGTPETIGSNVDALQYLLGASLTANDAQRLASAFARGWVATWQTVVPLDDDHFQALRNARDFMAAALLQAQHAEPPNAHLELTRQRLALAWLARRGLVSLLRASRHWHALPAVPTPTPDDMPAMLTPLLGEIALPEGRGRELCRQAALIDEGNTMNHCVGDYWNRCVHEAVRIWHLELTQANGTVESATAECRLDESTQSVRCEQLLGPSNTPPSEAMRRLAAALVQQLNRDDLNERRQELLAQSAAARLREHQRQTPRQSLRPLDLRLRRELAMVLHWAGQQADWLRPFNAADIAYSGTLAGFYHGRGPDLLQQLQSGDPLQLVREPDNPYDPQAVRVDWQGRKLGYIPRIANPALACLLDTGQGLQARIETMPGYDNGHWQAIQITVWSQQHDQKP